MVPWMLYQFEYILQKVKADLKADGYNGTRKSGAAVIVDDEPYLSVTMIPFFCLVWFNEKR